MNIVQLSEETQVDQSLDEETKIHENQKYIGYLTPIATAAAPDDDVDYDCTKAYTCLCSHLECDCTKYLKE